VVVINSSPSARAVRINEKRTTGGPATSAAVTGASMNRLGTYTGITGAGPDEHFTDIVFSGSLSLADENTLVSALNAIHNIPTLTDQVIFLGDSISVAYNTSDGQAPGRIFAANAARRVYAPVIGNPGQRQTTITSASATYAALYDAARFTGKQIIVNNAGTNDIYNGSTAAALYSSMSSWIASMKTAGFIVVVYTVIYQNVFGGPGSAVRLLVDDYNSQLKAGASAGGYTVIDLLADSRLATPTNTTYFQADGTHLTPAGNVVVESVIRPVLNGLLTA